MTNAIAATKKFRKRPSRQIRTASTLRLRHLMEAQQKLEIAERITELRERSPFTQPVVAEKLGLGLRGYQKLEAEGTTKYERCEEVAAIHREWSQRDPEWQHVSAGWVWDGQVREGSLLDALPPPSEATEVRELSETVDQLRRALEETRTELLSELESLRKAPASSRQKAKRTSRPRKASRK